jgi:hypothetical protein
MVGLAGVTARLTGDGIVTVSSVVPGVTGGTAPSVAVMVVEPRTVGIAVAPRPCEPLALLMVAMEVFDELHATCVVRSWLDPSV